MFLLTDVSFTRKTFHRGTKVKVFRFNDADVRIDFPNGERWWHPRGSLARIGHEFRVVATKTYSDPDKAIAAATKLARASGVPCKIEAI